MVRQAGETIEETTGMVDRDVDMPDKLTGVVSDAVPLITSLHAALE